MMPSIRVIAALSLLLVTSPLAAADWEIRLLDADAARRRGEYRTAVQGFKALLAIPEADLRTTLMVLGHSYIEWIQATAKGRGDYKPIIEAAINDLNPFAEKGNAEAQHWLGAVYEELTRDYARRKTASNEALKWYLMAAEQGHADAEWRLGGIYKLGIIGLEDARKDYRQARKWYQSAASKGHDGAQLDLGLLYAEGQGVARDYSRAIQWFQKAIKQGNRSAMVALGSMYETGRGVPRNETKANNLYQEAASHDNFFAKHVIEAKALAERNDPGGQYSLGIIWIYGTGVVRDTQEGVRWFEKAAKQGYVPAIYGLGKLYREGFGVPQDFVLAYKWFNIAASSGDDQAKKERDKLVKIMTPAQIAEGQKAAREWMAAREGK